MPVFLIIFQVRYHCDNDCMKLVKDPQKSSPEETEKRYLKIYRVQN